MSDGESPHCPRDVSTPMPGRYSDDRPIMTTGATASRSVSYSEVDEDVQFRRRVAERMPPVEEEEVPPPELGQAGNRGYGGMGPAPMGSAAQGPPWMNMHGFRPEPYDGEGDWSEYIIMFEQYADFSGWDARTRATMLGFCLRGPARSVLANLPAHRRLDFEYLKEALTQNFSPREQIHLYQAELKSRVRKQGESLTSLGRDISRMVRFAYPTADDPTRQTIGINAFLDALPCGAIEIRLHVAKSHPRTLQQAIAYAMEVDAVLEAEVRRGHALRRGQVKAAGDSEVQVLEQLRGELQRALDQMRAEFEKHKRVDSKREVTCYRCGKKGHMRRECRVPEDRLPQRGNEGEWLPQKQ